MNSRGSKSNYENWAKFVNDSGWNYKSTLPYFQKAEDTLSANDKNDNCGNSKDQYTNPQSVMMSTFLNAGKESGLKTEKIEFNLVDGRRNSNGKAYAMSALNRPNVTVFTKSIVDKVLFDANKKAYGLVFYSNRTKYFANVSKEVIFSSGAIDSARMLMLSGIGPTENLVAVGIPVVQDLPVGYNLDDQPAFYGLYFNTNKMQPVKSQETYIKEYLKGKGEYTWPNNLQGTIYANLGLGGNPNNSGVPDVQYLFQTAGAPINISSRAFGFTPEVNAAIMANVNPQSSFRLVPALLQQRSRGNVFLLSNSPFDFPGINSNFLSSPQDLQAMYQSIQYIIQFVYNSKAFRNINATLARVDLPQCSYLPYNSTEWWMCYIRVATNSLYNPTGTCAMGSVVDTNCTVLGVRGLRVIDSSIFPFTFSFSNSGPTTMVAERISDVIKKTYGA